MECKCGCGENVSIGKKYIHGHNVRIKHPKWKNGESRGYARNRYRIIIEKVLGEPLPEKAVIHHTDHRYLNNNKDNLVICEDNVYHLFLHMRERAYNACGNPSWRRCHICKKYDDPNNMYRAPSKSSYSHLSCRNKKQRIKYWKDPEKARARKRIAK